MMSDDIDIKKRVMLVQRAFGSVLFDRDGVNVAIGCVNKECSSFGKPAKKKLTLRVDNEFYHCWVCGLRGKGLAYFFRRYKPNFSSHAEAIFEKKIDEIKEDIQIVQLPEEFVLLASLGKNADPDLRACKNYLIHRGLTPRDLWYFKIGAVTAGRYRRRVIIPSFDDEGTLNYYTARAIDAEVTRKYLNPKVRRADVIFNDINIDWSQVLTLVEGPFDLIKSNENTSCLLGSTLSHRHELFKKIVKNKTPVILALDPDAIKKTHEIAATLARFDICVKILKFNNFSDVGEMPRGHLQQLLPHAEEWSEMARLRSLIGTIRSGSLI
jgi:hypothetical protein